MTFHFNTLHTQYLYPTLCSVRIRTPLHIQRFSLHFSLHNVFHCERLEKIRLGLTCGDLRKPARQHPKAAFPSTICPAVSLGGINIERERDVCVCVSTHACKYTYIRIYLFIYVFILYMYVYPYSYLCLYSYTYLDRRLCILSYTHTLFIYTSDPPHT